MQRIGVPTDVAMQLRKGSTLLRALVISLIAWVPASLLVSLAARSLGMWVSPLSGVRIFSTATLLGGITLMPAGIGSTGSIAISQLNGIGFSLAQAVVIVSLLRLTSTGVSLTAGVVFLVRELKAMRQTGITEATVHFNEIAKEYHDQFLPHIWNHLLNRKIDLVTAALPNSPPATGFGLDLGCGLGQQCLAMEKRGYRMVGVDISQHLLRHTCIAGTTVVTGSAITLPFQDESYTVGALHHLPGARAVDAACREVLMRITPLFVH